MGRAAIVVCKPIVCGIKVFATAAIADMLFHGALCNVHVKPFLREYCCHPMTDHIDNDLCRQYRKPARDHLCCNCFNSIGLRQLDVFGIVETMQGVFHVSHQLLDPWNLCRITEFLADAQVVDCPPEVIVGCQFHDCLLQGVLFGEHHRLCNHFSKVNGEVKPCVYFFWELFHQKSIPAFVAGLVRWRVRH